MAQEDLKPATDDDAISVEELDTVSGGVARADGLHVDAAHADGAHVFVRTEGTGHTL
jgi:hypothetical protein